MLVTNDPGWPIVRNWTRRRSAAPWVPGQVDQILGNLSALLKDIRTEPATDRPFAWPANGTVTTVRSAIKSLGSSGLIATAERGSSARVTPEAVHFMETGSAAHLIATFHAHVRFIGEALQLLQNPMTHDELNKEAEEKYGLAWTTHDQVQRRTNWLRAAGLIDLWKGSNRLVITEQGRTICSQLALADPDCLPGRRIVPTLEEITIDAPGPRISQELAALDNSRLINRKIQIGYIAGGSSVESVRRLVDASSPEIERADFVSFCNEHLGVKRSSAEQSLLSLIALGLVEQTGLDTYAPTAIAVEWLSTDRALDLVRILHCKTSLVGEVLHGLTHVSDSGDLHRWLLGAYPNSPIQRPDLTKRLSFLHEADLIEQIGHAKHRVTPLGEVFLRNIPFLSLRDDVVSEKSGNLSQTADNQAHAPALLARAREIVDSATDSANPARFEHAVADAFRALGLDVEWLGGPGKTDVSVVFWISPAERIRITVEAKTDSGGVVSERDIDFKTLEEHRIRHEADRVILVGPGFGGRVPARAGSDDIPLITAQNIADWLVRSISTRLLPREIFQLVFSPSQPNTDTVDDVWAVVEQRLDAVHRVGQALWESGNDPTDIAYNRGALSVRDLWRMLKTNRAPAPIGQEEIQEALSFLTAPVVAGAEKVKLDEYAATAPPPVVAARLRAMADVIENGLPLRSVTLARSAAKAAVAPKNDPVPMTSQVRAWATATGRPVSTSGRLPASLILEYQTAHRQRNQEA